uniref:EGF-like domain-containing protein n=1 Tax=Romanomermis culicivorax TaxID=13658 RepID=A0A915IJ29_ROMCU
MCINANMSDYECKCQEGYSGDHCETIDDICVARSPCYNGGCCMVQLVNKTSFFCLCKSGYHGIACQLEYYSFGYVYLNFYQYLAVLTLVVGLGTCVAFLIFNCLILEWIQSIKKTLLADG